MRTWHLIVFALMGLGLCLRGYGRWSFARPGAIGRRVPDVGTLGDVRGGRRSLYSFGGDGPLVLAFLGVDCPVANVSMPTLLRTERDYRQRGVQFVAVYSHAREDLDDVAAHAADHTISFPVLKDHGQDLADAVGVTRTPEICLLDRDMVLRYRGRINDQYAVGYRRARSTQDYLTDALDSLLAGESIETPEVSADGCLLDRNRRQAKRTDVTFAADVVSIMQRRCQGCHRPGQSAPFPLVEYDDVADHAEMIEEVVVERRMPPWHADGRYGEFANDRRLDASEIDVLLDWIEGGCEFGDKADLPAPLRWPEGWSIGQPDVVLKIAQEVAVPAEGVLDYRYEKVVDSEVRKVFAEDRWIRAAEVRPVAMDVTHHTTVYSVDPGLPGPPTSYRGTRVLATWTPGEPSFAYPKGTAVRVPKGAQIVFQIHHTPNGRATVDRPALGLVFADEPPKYEIMLYANDDEEFVIPPGHPHFMRGKSFDCRQEGHMNLLGLYPHMHVRGKSYRFEAEFPNGQREVLLSVPRYDFNWQTFYWLKKPTKLPQGTRILMIATWDNSRHNPQNPDPNAEVRFGPQTTDEMMTGVMTFMYPVKREELK